MDPLVERGDEIEEMLGTLLIARPPDDYTSDSPSFRSSASAVRVKSITVAGRHQIGSGPRSKWIRLRFMELEGLDERPQDLSFRWSERDVRLQWIA
jgi:hypothetical protein